MMITIKSERIVGRDGTRCRKIINIEGVKAVDDLPAEYVNGFHFRTAYNDEHYILFFNVPSHISVVDFGVGTVLLDEDYEYALKKMGERAIRLATINMSIRKLKKEWFGEEEVRL